MTDKCQDKKWLKPAVLAKWSLPETFDIEPQQDRVFSVVLDVPWNTPITLGDSSCGLRLV